MLEELKNEVEFTPENSQNEAELAPENNQNEKKYDSTADYNLRNLRLIAEREAARAQYAEERLREYEQQKRPSEDDDLDSDDIMDKKEFKKYYKKINEKSEASAKETENLRQELAYYQNIATEEILKNKFKGFSTIVNNNNLKKLEAEDEVLYNSIMANKTLMQRGEAAYKILKIHLADKQSQDEQKARIEENKNRPKSAATVGGQENMANPLAEFQDKKRWKPEVKYK